MAPPHGWRKLGAKISSSRTRNESSTSPCALNVYLKKAKDSEKHVLFRPSRDLHSFFFSEDLDSMVSDEEGLCSVGACVVQGGSACAVGLSGAHAEDRRLVRVDQAGSLWLKSAARDPTTGSTVVPQVTDPLDRFLEELALVVSRKGWSTEGRPQLTPLPSLREKCLDTADTTRRFRVGLPELQAPLYERRNLLKKSGLSDHTASAMFREFLAVGRPQEDAGGLPNRGGHCSLRA